MTYLAVIQTALSIIAAVVGYLHDRQLIAAGVAEAVSANLKGAMDEIQKAMAVRDTVRSGFDPAKLPTDDPNRRD